MITYIQDEINVFESSSNSLANVSSATDWAHDDRLTEPSFFASLSGVVVVGGFGRSTFAEPRTVMFWNVWPIYIPLSNPAVSQAYHTWVWVALVPVELRMGNTVPEALPLGIRPEKK